MFVSLKGLGNPIADEKDGIVSWNAHFAAVMIEGGAKTNDLWAAFLIFQGFCYAFNTTFHTFFLGTNDEKGLVLSPSAVCFLNIQKALGMLHMGFLQIGANMEVR